jgi:hypothetical protein
VAVAEQVGVEVAGLGLLDDAEGLEMVLMIV